jgi:predicted nucleic acid-binding protein
MAWCFEDEADRYSDGALARAHRISAYDASCLHLAIRTGLPIATRDRALRAAARVMRVAAFAPV